MANKKLSELAAASAGPIAGTDILIGIKGGVDVKFLGSQVVGTGPTGPTGPTGATGATGPSSGGGLLSGGVITLSSAQLLDLANTPVDIVAAPGANEAIVPVNVISTLTSGDEEYPNGVSTILVHTGGIGSMEVEIAPFVETDGIKSGPSYYNYVLPTGGLFRSTSQGLGLLLSASDGDPSTSGDGTATIEVFYRIVSWP